MPGAMKTLLALNFLSSSDNSGLFSFSILQHTMSLRAHAPVNVEQ